MHEIEQLLDQLIGELVMACLPNKDVAVPRWSVRGGKLPDAVDGRVRDVLHYVSHLRYELEEARKAAAQPAPEKQP